MLNLTQNKRICVLHIHVHTMIKTTLICSFKNHYNQCHSSLYEQIQAHLYTLKCCVICHVAIKMKNKDWNIQTEVQFQNLKLLLHFKLLKGFELAAPLYKPLYMWFCEQSLRLPSKVYTWHLRVLYSHSICILFSLTASMPSFRFPMWSEKHN